MHLPDRTPENHLETTFEPDGSGTLMTVRMTLPDAKMRDAMLATGMQHGMEAQLRSPRKDRSRRVGCSLPSFLRSGGRPRRACRHAVHTPNCRK